jgi:hypothetical protein
MLKKASLHPPGPRRAETRPIPTCVLASKNPQRIQWTEPVLAGSGLGG